MYISFFVKEEVGVQRTSWPVNGSIPIKEGELFSIDGICLKDIFGNLIPADLEVISRWQKDNSIKWIRTTFEADLKCLEEKEYLLTIKEDCNDFKEAQGKILIKESDDRLIVINNKMEFALSKKDYKIFDYIKREGKLIVNNSSRKGFFIVQDGKCFSSDNCKNVKFSIEEQGKIRTIIRVSGQHVSKEGEVLFNFIVRYFIYINSDLVRVDYTFINMEETDSVMISKVGYELEMEGFGYKGTCGYYDGIRVIEQEFSLEMEEVVDTTPLTGHSCELIIPDKSRKKGAYFENRIHGWAGMSNDKHGLNLLIYRLAENFPKAFRYNGEEAVSVDLWFNSKGEKLEFMQGWAKTHRLYFSFYDGSALDSESHKTIAALENPLTIFVPKGYQETKVIGDFFPYMPKEYPQFEISLRDIFYVWKSRNRPFGMVDYGDFPQLGDDGREDYMGNNEHDFAHSMLMQYMRTGEREYYFTAEDSIMHTLDIDMAHHSKWIDEIGGVREHGPNHGANYVNGPYAHPSHMWLEGILEYYCMTGDKRILELAKTMADYFIKFVDRIVHYPPERTQAWTLIALTTYFDVTGDSRTYENCDKLATYIVEWYEKNGDLFCNFGFRKSWSGFHVGLLVEGLFKYYNMCKESNKKERIRKVILGSVDSIIEHGMFEEGSFIYIDYPGYRFNRYGGDMIEPFGYAYALSKDDKYIKASCRDLVRCHDIIITNLGPSALKVNYKNQVVSVFGECIGMNWRGLFRYMYFAHESGLLKDFFL